jgi:hypothetical protein
MGITIHFEGKLRSSGDFEMVLQLAVEYARAMGWPTETINERETKLLRVRDEKEWDYIGPTQGIALYPHEDCEPVRLEFDRDLYIQEYTKTQFAGPEVHVWIATLLRRVEPHFQQLLVIDEGEYWDTNDMALLTRHIQRCAEVIAEEAAKSPRPSVKVKLPDRRIIDIMQ